VRQWTKRINVADILMSDEAEGTGTEAVKATMTKVADALAADECFEEIAEDMRNADSAEEANFLIEEMYDLADSASIWLGQ
jgi:hypothetical protein